MTLIDARTDASTPIIDDSRHYHHPQHCPMTTTTWMKMRFDHNCEDEDGADRESEEVSTPRRANTTNILFLGTVDNVDPTPSAIEDNDA